MTGEAQTYYAECLLPDEERGLRIAVTLTKTADDQTLPEMIPDGPCIGTECPHGGKHDLLPISAFAAEKLMADEEDEDRKTNVFEWCWEHVQVEGDDRRVLLYLAFHAGHDDSVWLMDMSVAADALGLGGARLVDSLANLCNRGQLEERHGHTVYVFPAFEAWKAKQ